MSNIYHTEPPTSGKVLLRTTVGDIDIELWPKEAPLACRNFVQHCLNGYYDGCLFHRIITGFMAQTGDPSGTGEGGESVWGRSFKDETHGRIKFNHRGQVACANEQTPNSNHSQFFFTLAACEWLDRKHTIFGKVTGDTIFNMLRLGDAEVDSSDRPLDDVCIHSAEVLSNPFPDVDRQATGVGKAEADKAAAAVAATTAKAKAGRKAVKNATLLSFEMDEEQQEGGDTRPAKKKRKTAASAGNAEDILPTMGTSLGDTAAAAAAEAVATAAGTGAGVTVDGVEKQEGHQFQDPKSKLQQMKAALAARRAEAANARSGRISTSEAAARAAAAANAPQSALERMRCKFLAKGAGASAAASLTTAVSQVTGHRQKLKLKPGSGSGGGGLGGGSKKRDERAEATLTRLSSFKAGSCSSNSSSSSTGSTTTAAKVAESGGGKSWMTSGF